MYLKEFDWLAMLLLPVVATSDGNFYLNIFKQMLELNMIFSTGCILKPFKPRPILTMEHGNTEQHLAIISVLLFDRVMV